jgi:hypothetical protein
MKAFQTSIGAVFVFTIASVSVFSLASCARHHALTSPAQVSQLPVSRGLNGGSYVAETPWQYRGSHYGTHEFFYYHHTGNRLHRREVSIPRHTAALHFPEVVFGSQPQWVTLQPHSTTFQFYLPRPDRH